jgi:serine/threonine-protein kinase
MELLEGESLAQRLKRGPLSVAETVELGIQVCRGLAVAHGRGIVHRDLTPSNVFLCRGASGNRVAKILDFGIALGAAGSGEPVITADAHAGTAPYMAPEQARASTEIDRRVDIYALGTILYEALAGQRAHPGDSYGVVVYHLLRQAITPLDRHQASLPAPLVEIIHKALAADPDRRWKSADEMETALASLAPDVRAPKVAVPSRSRRLRAGATVAFVLLMVAGVLVTRQELRGQPIAAGPQEVQPSLPAPVVEAPPEHAAVSSLPSTVELAVPMIAAPARGKDVRPRKVDRRAPPIRKAPEIAETAPLPAPAARPESPKVPPAIDPVTFERQNPYR